MTNQTDAAVRLFVEYHSEELIAEGIFADFVQNGRLEVRMCWTSSGAISLAESWLLTTPDIYIALALKCSGNPEEFRAPIRNILSRDAREERWHVALAIPDMKKWLLFDPKFAEAVDNAPVSLSTNPDVAVFFNEWVNKSNNQFDREEVSKQDAEFAALNKFIEEHALSTTRTTAS